MAKGIKSEVVCNTGSPTLVLSANAFSNVTLNGDAVYLTGSGYIIPATFGSEYYYPSVNVNVYVGGNGNSADVSLVNFAIAANSIALNNNCFSFDTVVVLRGNNVNGNVNTNTSFYGTVKTSTGLVVGTPANGKANVVVTTSNTANLTVYGVPGSVGQNGAVVIFEHCHISNPIA